MGVIWTSRTRNRQPVGKISARVQVAQDNTLARALTAGSVPAFGLRDVVTGESWTTWGTAPVRTATARGFAWDTTAAFGGLMLESRLNIAKAYQTHLLIVETTATSGAFAGLIGVGDAGGANNSLVYQRNDSDSNWRTYPDASTIGPTAKVFGPTVMVFRAAASGRDLFHGGVVVGSVANAATAQSSSRIVLFGERSASTTYATKARLWGYFGWSRALTDDEVVSVSRNPWQLLAPERRPVFYSLPAAGGTSSAVVWNARTRTRQPLERWVRTAREFENDMVVAHIGNSLTVRKPRTGEVDGVFTTMSSEPAGPPFVYADTIGLALDLTHDRAILSSNIADTDSFTVLTFVKPYAGGLVALRMWFTRGSDSSGGWSIYFGNNSSGLPFIAVVLTAGGTTYYDAVGSSALSVTDWTAVAGTFDAASGVLKLFVNGVLAATTSTGNSVLRSSAFKLFMGGDTDSTGGSYYGRRGPMFVLKRAMSSVEIAGYSRNPWQLLAPERRPKFFSVGSGANTYAVGISEMATASETVSMLAAFGASISETATASETVSMLATFLVGISETATASETVAMQLANQTYAVDISETATASDTVVMTIPTTYAISIIETVQAGDYVSMGVPSSDFWTQVTTTQSAGWGQINNTQSSGWTIIPTT